MKYSILVLCYNNEGTIKRCLDSIINQTVKNFNLIIVDDGSTDKSRKIINEYRKYDNVYIYFKENTGVADTRNFAIKKVRTKYFTFVDGDDYIDKNLLKECDKYNNYDILAFASYEINEKGKIKNNNTRGNFNINNGVDAFIELLENGKLILTPWGYIYNIDLFRKNKLKYSIGYVHEDFGLSPIAILKSNNVQAIEFFGYYYVQTKRSITRGNNSKEIDHRIDSMIYQYRYLKEYIKKNIFDTYKRKKILNYFATQMLYFGSQLNSKKRKEYFHKIQNDKIYYDFSSKTYYSKVVFFLSKESMIFTRVFIRFRPPVARFVYTILGKKKHLQ